MKKYNLLIISLLICWSASLAQNVGIGTTNPDASSVLEIQSTTKGLLIPRMSMLQRINIVSPTEGLMIYQTDSVKGFYYFNGLQWRSEGTQKNLILLRKYVYNPTSSNEIWMANLDGSNLHKVPVVLPAGIDLGNEFRLNPNGDKIIFEASGANVSYIYSCNLDGSGIHQIIAYPLLSGSLILNGVY